MENRANEMKRERKICIVNCMKIDKLRRMAQLKWN